jgi:hypothetical protein
MLCALGVGGTASANHPPTQLAIAESAGAPAWSSSGLSAPSIAKSATASFAAPAPAALPPRSEGFQFVSKLGLETPMQYRTTETRNQALMPGQIADVAVFKNTAYVNSWAEETCERGGFWSVDISDPANPKQLAFVAARANQYHGEGAHAISLKLPDGFQGDLLAVNNEPCDDRRGSRGGFDLYDVTNPASPVTLVQSFGDRSPDRAPDQAFAPLTGNQTPNSSHSIFVWQDGDKAYAVTTDNTEAADVDIYDITEPTAPVHITDVDLVELGKDQGIDVVGNSGNAEWIYNHDMVVKKINGVQTMLVSYWDAGYIKLDVSEPANPKIVGDSDFGTQDPIMKRASTGQQWSLPEGNAHQAEFSHDNRFVLAADEDFDTHRTIGVVDQGAAGPYNFSGAGFAVKAGGVRAGPRLENSPLIGNTRFVGAACTPASIEPATATVKIAVVEVTSCVSFQKMTENAEVRGYTGVILFAPPDGDLSCDTVIRMSFPTYAGNALTLWVTRETGLRIIGQANPQTCSTAAPAAPKDGNPVNITAEFDGWGYTHLFRNDATLTPIDSYAIEEAQDPSKSAGFGDLTVHEFATDATENIAYSSYYAGGIRAFSFGDNGLEPTGTYIDTNNDFWGIEQFTTANGERLLAGSDRNVGLYLLRYDGPGAPVRPVCSDTSATTPVGAAVSIPLSCTDANGNPLTLRVAGRPARGTAAVSGTTATYTPRPGTSGADTFTIVANDGAADSAPATVTVTNPVLPAGLKAGPCANDLLGTAARETLAGTSAGDRILGRAGNDVIRGHAGDDCILGEAGNDRLAGDAGNDDVDGGVGNDRVDGGAGTDEIAGGSGRDAVLGGSGNDRATGGAGVDSLSGGAGRDRLDGGSGNDSASGGSGNDRVDGGSGNDKLSGGAGRDTLRGGAGRDTINARGGGRDTIDCGAGRDTVTADRTDKVARNCEVVRRR